MAAVTGCTASQALPNAGVSAYIITTPATADSGDTVDLSSAAAAGIAFTEIYACYFGWDATTGDLVTATIAAGSTNVTIDAAGGTTNHVYKILAFGRI